MERKKCVRADGAAIRAVEASTDETVGIISNSSISRGLFISTGAGTTFIEAFFSGVGDETTLQVVQ